MRSYCECTYLGDGSPVHVLVEVESGIELSLTPRTQYPDRLFEIIIVCMDVVVKDSCFGFCHYVVNLIPVIPVSTHQRNQNLQGQEDTYKRCKEVESWSATEFKMATTV